ncbi:MAG TPA: HAMP domain-containing sensor histidine kinase [Saprospiraceae bacterium]|nr:HAMP domain-containing sensor histidine kinase [Saprospiraceae bacterium]
MKEKELEKIYFEQYFSQVVNPILFRGYLHDSIHTISDLSMQYRLLIYELEKLNVKNDNIKELISYMSSLFSKIKLESISIAKKLSADRIELYAKIDLRVALNNALILYNNKLEDQKNVNIKFNLNENRNYFIWACELQIEYCIIQIINNALESEFLNKKLEINIAIRTKNNKYIIEIKDNGIGIKLDYQEIHIFQPYFTTKINNSGLGLTITKFIMENHHGIIVIKSKENKGTLVKLIFNKYE